MNTPGIQQIPSKELYLSGMNKLAQYWTLLEFHLLKLKNKTQKEQVDKQVNGEA